MQGFIQQRDRDAALISLMQTIGDVHDFVLEADPLKIYRSQREVLDTMVQQTVECTYFIRDYARDGLGE